MAAPKPKFMMLGKSKFVHVVRTKAYDLKHSQCQHVRKLVVAEKIDYKDKGMSPEAAAALEPCPNCETAGVLANLDTPEVKRAKAKEKADDFTHRFREENRPKTGVGKAKKARAKGADHPKSVRKSGGGSSRAQRSSGDSTKEKADALAAFAVEHGWATVTGDADPGIMVEAARDGETIRCYFVDGKYDATRMASVTVGTWSGKLRGVHGCRKQMANEGRDRPHPEPGKGRGATKTKKKGKHEVQEEDIVPEDESPEDAAKRVPFLIDDEDAEIITTLLGKTIRWRNGQSGAMDQAVVPSSAKGSKRPKVVISAHPKTGRKVVDFLEVVGNDAGREVYGPERVVALDKIVRVIG